MRVIFDASVQKVLSHYFLIGGSCIMNLQRILEELFEFTIARILHVSTDLFLLFIDGHSR